MKTVIITGCTGQDGSYMADYLLARTDFKIYGMVRHTSSVNTKNLTLALKNPRFKIVKGDLTDLVSLSRIVDEIKPDYFINFAAQSFVAESWNSPVNTFEINALGVLYCLEALRKHAPLCRFYSAGTSEEVGDVDYCPQDINHPLKPRSPYGAAKAAAKHLVKVYRESYNMYAIHGRLYNHESERRGELFVTRKITKGVARISCSINSGLKFEPIQLGNIDVKRDWSHAWDFCDGIWRMLNQEAYNGKLDAMVKEFDRTGKLLLPRNVNPAWFDILVKNAKEYVLSSNETHTVREFVEKAFACADIKGVWRVEDGPASEIYLSNEEYQRPLVTINPKFYRPAEVNILLGDSNPIREELGWKPLISFDELVKCMVKNDIAEYRASETQI
jgi:GDPmannose 4,6-dehydratase